MSHLSTCKKRAPRTATLPANQDEPQETSKSPRYSELSRTIGKSLMPFGFYKVQWFFIAFRRKSNFSLNIASNTFNIIKLTSGYLSSLQGYPGVRGFEESTLIVDFFFNSLHFITIIKIKHKVLGKKLNNFTCTKPSNKIF